MKNERMSWRASIATWLALSAAGWLIVILLWGALTWNS